MADVYAKYKELNEMYGIVGDVKVVMGENNVLTNQVEQLTTQLQQSNIRETHDREQAAIRETQWNNDREQATIRETRWNTRDDEQTRELKQLKQRQKVRQVVKQKMLEVEVKISQETDPEVKDQLTSRLEDLIIVLRKQSPSADDSD
jgi:hypothetical protein